MQGRFTNPDPLLSSGRKAIPQSWNRYSYVINNPLKYNDPTGQCPFCESFSRLLEQLKSAFGVSRTELEPDITDADVAGSTPTGNGQTMNGLVAETTAAMIQGSHVLHSVNKVLDSTQITQVIVGAATGIDSPEEAGFTIAISIISPGILHKVGDIADALKDVSMFRSSLNLPAVNTAADIADPTTIARLDIGEHSFYGISAHGQNVSLRVNAISRTHAEADVFQQALNSGARDDFARLVVDRALCTACGQNGAVASMARQLGIRELQVITPAESKIIKIH
ncbi:MAG TPA: deaminase [Blastocatellia bacterium]|nr:deaminase [Blastocatellia bacterium]HNG33700.1 deaminase [Blastocatellia bacterium]